MQNHLRTENSSHHTGNKNEKNSFVFQKIQLSFEFQKLSRVIRLKNCFRLCYLSSLSVLLVKNVWTMKIVLFWMRKAFSVGLPKAINRYVTSQFHALAPQGLESRLWRLSTCITTKQLDAINTCRHVFSFRPCCRFFRVCFCIFVDTTIGFFPLRANVQLQSIFVYKQMPLTAITLSNIQAKHSKTSIHFEYMCGFWRLVIFILSIFSRIHVFNWNRNRDTFDW